MADGRVQFLNPDGLVKSPAFSNLAVVTGSVKTVYIGGQDPIDADGNVVGKGDLGTQTEQVLKNIKIALAAAGALPEHVVKWNIYVLQGQSVQEGFEAFQRIWGMPPSPPLISVVYVAALGHPDWLLEMEAIAVIPE
jgi:enamine deaminase RidA (YjgF/YER057c/UK114 family)